MSEPNANAIPSTRAANRSRTHKLTISAMLSGVAFLLMFIEFPIPALIPSFVKLDVSDLPELLAAFSLGPVYGIVVTFLKNLLFSVLHGTSSAYVGEVFNFIMGGVFAFSAGFVYQRNKSRKGALLGAVIGAVLMSVGGTGLKWFALAGIAGAGAIAAAVVLLPELVPYAMGRLSSWRDPFADPLGEGHQTIQSLYAIASGGAAGLGLGNSRQKYLYVPEPQNDFIFSILCEELGFVGAALTVVLFLLLFLRGMSIAVRARDKFGALLAVGFVVQVVLQAVLNIAVVTNTIPNTGISLPFFSSGGTSLMMLLGEMGIVLSVSRQADAR